MTEDVLFAVLPGTATDLGCQICRTSFMVLQFRALFKGWMETITLCLLPYHYIPRIQYFLGAYLC